MLTGVINDVRYASRGITKNFRVSLLLIAILGVAIGAIVTVFTIYDTIELRSLAIRDAKSLLLLRWSATEPQVQYLTGQFSRDGMNRRITSWSFSYPSYDTLRRGVTAAGELVAAASGGRQIVVSNGNAELANVELVSGNYYEMLRISATQGRPLAPLDAAVDSSPRAVLSYQYWQRRFASNADIVGSTVRIAARDFVIVGVIDRDFTSTLQIDSAPDVIVPLAAQRFLNPGRPYFTNPQWYWLEIIGRPRQGVAPSEFERALETVFREDPDVRASGMALEFASGRQGLSRVRDTERQPLAFVLGAAGAILLMACIGCGGVLAARIVARASEIRLKQALGASRWRLLRPHIIEAVMLTACGGFVGLLLSPWWTKTLMAWLIPDASLIVLLDWHTWLFASLMSVAAGLLCALLPAIRATRVGISLMTTGIVTPAYLMERALIVVEVALSVMLLIQSTLLVQTVRNVHTTGPGVSNLSVQLFKVQLPSVENRTAVAARLVERLDHIPGVTAVGVSDHQVLNDGIDRTGVSIDGEQGSFDAYINRVGSQYFRAMGIRFENGGPPSWVGTDARSAHEAVVNATFRLQYLAGRDPVGLSINGLQIVGVVSDAKYGRLRDAAPPTIFTSFFNNRGNGAIAFQVATVGNESGRVPLIQAAVRQVVPEAVMFSVTTPRLEQLKAAPTEAFMANATTFTGVVALLLTGLVIFGSVQHSVWRRTREIGVRVALGAVEHDVVLLVAGRTILLALAGCLIGAGSGAAIAMLLRAVLYGVAPTDLFSIALAIGATLCGTAIACIPAIRHALQLQPAVALRVE